jgi:two-component system, sensor histidine kinase PdtaS
LITNSLKYAFPSVKEGQITVQIKKDLDVITVSVSDNGIGLPADVDFSTSGSFGFRIVRLLAEQISASIQMHRKNGTSFEISVPAELLKIGVINDDD